MKRDASRSLSLSIRATIILFVLACASLSFACNLNSKKPAPTSSKLTGTINNNHPIVNPGGESATFSTTGSVNLTGEFFQPQGANNQSCASCHIPEEAWSITPATLERLFKETDGKHPVFNTVDANNPNADVSTTEARRKAFSMLLTRGLFRRGGAPPADAEWEVIAVEDPNGFASANNLVHWRRSIPTMNFPLGSSIINWDSGSSRGTNQRAGLVNLTNRLITKARGGEAPPADLVERIVDFQNTLWTAQLTVTGVGRLDADGARGGPEALSKMQKARGGFNIFDAWKNSPDPKRAQIARGQDVFNSLDNPSMKSCIVCHNSENNGTNFVNDLFDIRTSSEEARTPDLPLYTFRNKKTGETVKLTDAGLGFVTGLWEDLGRFKTPTLRGLAARAPYFHNGIAMTLEDVVRHYETRFGFIFTDQERADLVAFLNAL